MSDSNPVPVLELQDVTVVYRQAGCWFEVVRGVSFQVQAGEVYGLVGESGAGKSTIALAVLQYLGINGAIREGKIRLNGYDLTATNRVEMGRIWGRQVALVPQNPGSSLNPSMRIGEQIGEILRYQHGLGVGSIKARVQELMEMVRIADPERVAHSFPHQISGGMAQRVLIAMALSSEPSLLILDEPTTNLDVTTQATILELIKELIHARNTAVLYITHNLGVVTQMCDRVGVLYAGELVEEADKQTLFSKPLHPYTVGLLESVPRLGDLKGNLRLQAIEGTIPSLGERPAGCSFAPRCPIALDLCAEKPELSTTGKAHQVRCHRWEEILAGEVLIESSSEPVFMKDEYREGTGQEVLALDQVEVHYPLRRSLPAVLRGETQQVVRAVDGISIKVDQGQTLGLVGESGSGKTTLARAIAGLEAEIRGSVEFLGLPLPTKLSARNVEILRQLQMVFQNPEGALNPYMPVAETLYRPLISLLGMSRAAAQEKAKELLEEVRLPASFMERPVTQLSGGEKQRVAIARALASYPHLLICDEPVSSLDVSVQASIINLLRDLQARHGTSLLFISHDLAVVSYLADIIAVVYLGQLVELGRVEDLFTPPYHPYTEVLLSAIPVPDPNFRRKNVRLEGEIPSPVDKPSGCPFHTRCPHVLGEICEQQVPPWQEQKATGKRYWCHIPEGELSAIQKPVLNGRDSMSE